MIEETCFVIGALEEFYEAERVARCARRNKIRHIDQLIDELEVLNLADELEIPLELKARVATFLGGERHPVVDRCVDEIAISEWMEALYDIQDTLMVPLEEEVG